MSPYDDEPPLQDGDDTVSSSDGSFMPPVLSDYANQLLFEDKDRYSRLQMLQQRQQENDQFYTHHNQIQNLGYQDIHNTAPPIDNDDPPIDKMSISPQVPTTTKRKNSISPNSIGSSSASSSSSVGTSPPASSDKLMPNTSTTPGIRPAATSFTRAPAADMTTLRTSTMRSKRFGSNAFNKRLGKPLNFKGLPAINTPAAGATNSTSTALSSIAQLSVSNSASASASASESISASSILASSKSSNQNDNIFNTHYDHISSPAEEDKNMMNISPSARRNNTRIRFADQHEEIPPEQKQNESPHLADSRILRHTKSTDSNGGNLNYWQYQNSSDIAGSSAANSSVNSIPSSERDRKDRENWLTSRATTPLGDNSRHSNGSNRSDGNMKTDQNNPQLSRLQEPNEERPALQNLSPNIPPQSSRFGPKVPPPPKLENWGYKSSSLFNDNKYHDFQEAERPAPPLPTDRADKAARFERFERLAAGQQNSITPDPIRPVTTTTMTSDRPRSGDRKAKKNMMSINSKLYQRLELLGRGGSSKVYKVQSNEGKVFAVKKVTFDDVDESVIIGFKGEIDLLQRLRNEDRVVKLIDYEMHDTSVYLVMECGEIDLAHVLSARLNSQLDISFVRYYATEMLRCVAAVHDHGIVHSDLKPANFLLVKGMLKIIDFGIANVVPDYTANIHRDTQIGTPNYMAPEALLDANQFAGSDVQTGAKFKVGKPSDVWSCGCIIYQMVYGKPPYAAYSGAQRMLAIMNPKIQIQYPKHGLGGVRVSREAIETIRGCLHRDPPARMTLSDVLDGSFLNPQAVDKNFIKSLLEHAVQYGTDRKEPISAREVEMLADDVWKKIQLSNR